MAAKKEYVDVWGVFQKRDVPGNKVWCRGKAIRQEDGSYLFIPNDKRLKPVPAVKTQN